MMDFHEYAASRGVTPEMVEAVHEESLQRIEAYNLAQARKSQRITQRQLAELIGVAQPRISAIENGSVDSVELGTLRKYVHGLGAELALHIEWPDRSVRLEQTGR